MRLGLIVILVGILFFFKNIGIINIVSWNILWPVIVMLIGIAMVLRKECGCGGWGCKWCRWCKGTINRGMDMNTTCTCECDSCKNCGDYHSPRKKM